MLNVDVDYWNTAVNKWSWFIATAVSTADDFSVVSFTAVTRAAVPPFEFWRTYFTTESQVIAAVFVLLH